MVGANLVFTLITEKAHGIEFSQKMGEHKVRLYNYYAWLLQWTKSISRFKKSIL